MIAERGVIPRIVELLSSNNDVVAFEAAWCVTNIACGDHIYIDMLLNLCTVPKLIQSICQTTKSNIVEQSLWAISNIITDERVEIKKELLNLGIMNILLWQLDIEFPAHQIQRQESPSLSIIRYSSWILCSLCK